MPVLRCPDCSTVVAWRGKQLATTCPGSAHGGLDVRLHVDETLAEDLNGDAIDAHLSGVERREQAAAAYERRMDRWVKSAE